MESLGRNLKSIREGKGITLEQIANETRISLRHLQSLEDDRYERLPGGLYNRAFLRAYCASLGIDSADFLDRLARESSNCATQSAPDMTSDPVILQRPFAFPPPILLCAGFVLLALALFWGRNWLGAVFAPYLARPPVARMGDSDSKTHSPAQIPAVRIASNTEAALRPDSTTARAVASPDGLAHGSPSPLEPKESLRLEFEVVESCWVSVHSDGENVLVRLLKPGEDLTLAASNRFYLVLGNAGGVNLKINGQPARTLGKPGEVVRMLINEQNLSDLLEKSVG